MKEKSKNEPNGVIVNDSLAQARAQFTRDVLKQAWRQVRSPTFVRARPPGIACQFCKHLANDSRTAVMHLLTTHPNIIRVRASVVHEFRASFADLL